MRVLMQTFLLLVVLSLCAASAGAAERVINASLLTPVQIFPETDDVKGVRFNLIYGRNADVTGFDFGIVAGHATGDFTGVQWHWVNLADGSMTGWQWGWLYNRAGGDFLGIQAAPVNQTSGTGEGVMFGLVNVGRSMNGLMLGFVNVTDDMYGLQIGLLNIIKNKEKLPIFPIVNWNF